MHGARICSCRLYAVLYAYWVLSGMVFDVLVMARPHLARLTDARGVLLGGGRC